jgi:hypothetical protein
MMAGLGINPAFNWQRFGGNALQDIGVGLTQAPNVWGGLGRGAQINQAQQPYRDQMATLEEERKREALEKNQTSEWIKANFPQYSNLPPAQAWQAAMGDLQAKRSASTGDNLTTDQRNWQMAQQDPAFAEFLKTGDGGVKHSFTPQWYQMEDESFGFGVLAEDGTFKPVATPEGAKMLDPRSLNIEKGAGTTIGKGQGETITAAPMQLSNGGMALGLVEQIRNHPELPWATGRSAAFGMNDPRLNPQRAAFQDLVEQSKGGAFLTAIQQLQGMGALSNAEGATATAAMNRINTAVEKDDFLKALKDYEDIVKKGMERAKAILASQGLNEMGLPGSGSAPSGGTSYTFNPATGELE